MSSLSDEERRAIGTFAVAVVNAFQDVKEAGENLINVFGKPYENQETQQKAEKPTLDEISSLFWEDKEGSRGPYKQTSKVANQNSLAFRKLQAFIKEHKGFVTLHGFKLWQFSNNPDIIGRRKA